MDLMNPWDQMVAKVVEQTILLVHASLMDVAMKRGPDVHALVRSVEMEALGKMRGDLMQMALKALADLKPN